MFVSPTANHYIWYYTASFSVLIYNMAHLSVHTWCNKEIPRNMTRNTN